MKTFLSLCAGAAFCILASCSEGPTKQMPYNQGINVIPTPVSLVQNEGSFKLSKNTAFSASTPEAKTVAEYFAAQMNLATGYQITVSDKAASNGIALAIDEALDVNDEGYTLDVTPQGVTVKAKTPQGLFYGMQTFMQLLPAEIQSPAVVNGIAWTASCVTVKDEPRFEYRGIMLDPCRHFIPVENVKKHLDVLALFKINRMHWHLTDDQGWRIEIKKYPKLTEVGSKRIDGEGTEYSGFYTQDQIKEVVKYAADRFITIVPEIELPGHELAEIGWTPLARKDYKDFERRLDNALVRLDELNINYHIPQPEQPNGSCDFVAFTDKASLEFKTTRPVKVVYTIDGTEPTPESTAYSAPIEFTESGVLKIRSVLPSGKMSKTRTITVEKQALAPAKEVAKTTPGLEMQVTDGMFLNSSKLGDVKEWKKSVIKDLREITSVVKSSESMRGVKQYAAIATGYVNIPEDGVYYISSDNEEVWIDGKLLVNNAGEVKRFSRHDSSAALSKGLHEIKVVFLGHIIGGWPSNWNDGSVKLRKADSDKFVKITPEMLVH